MAKKLLLFGGAFNPPHKGHERLLRAAMEAVRPDMTVILPTGTSPHKQQGTTGFYHRAAMCRVFLPLGKIRVSLIEAKGRKRRNYTVRSVKRFQKMYPGYEILLLIGGDMLKSFGTWSRYRRLLSMVTLVVASREGERDPALERSAEQIRREGGRVLPLPFRPVVVSSSELRETLRVFGDAGRYMDEEVIAYIRRQGLYG